MGDTIDSGSVYIHSPSKVSLAFIYFCFVASQLRYYFVLFWFVVFVFLMSHLYEWTSRRAQLVASRRALAMTPRGDCHLQPSW